VIDAYRDVKKRFPETQLALVGSMAHDDPEGWEYYNRTVEHADGDSDIYILSNLNNVGAVEVNAFQVHSSAVIQKSIKEGFWPDGHRSALEGATDCRGARRWDRRPDHGRRDGLARRIRARMRAGMHRDPARSAGGAVAVAQGKEHVRRNFLTPRLLRDWLVLFKQARGERHRRQRDYDRLRWPRGAR